MLTRFFGPDWTEELIEHVLFDLEHSIRTGAIALPRGLELIIAHEDPVDAAFTGSKGTVAQIQQ